MHPLRGTDRFARLSPVTPSGRRLCRLPTRLRPSLVVLPTPEYDKIGHSRMVNLSGASPCDHELRNLSRVLSIHSLRNFTILESDFISVSSQSMWLWRKLLHDALERKYLWFFNICATTNFDLRIAAW